MTNITPTPSPTKIRKTPIKKPRVAWDAEKTEHLLLAILATSDVHVKWSEAARKFNERAGLTFTENAVRQRIIAFQKKDAKAREEKASRSSGSSAEPATPTAQRFESETFTTPKYESSDENSY
jgi:hypothetical protein